MVYDDPAGLDGVFTPDITVRDLQNYTGNGNPICYISSVTYGRIYYLLYESSATKEELNAALAFSYNGTFYGAKVEAEANFAKTMTQTNARVFQIGGNAERGFTPAMALDMEAIKEFLDAGANFSAKSPGAPISYTVKYLKNAKVVRMNNTMEYEIENCTTETTENECYEHKMVFVQGGTFDMGSPDGVGEENERPQHKVTLSSFNIGKYPVTQAQWIAVMGSNPSRFKGDNLPVEQMNWTDIVGTSGASMVINGIIYYENGFIYRLNKLTGKNYRLPTESEWEYAARGGNQSKGYTYSGSNEIDKVAWYGGNSEEKTHPVGEKVPNELGIYDMSGNVFEWCSDWYGAYNDDPKTNPTGPTDGPGFVTRGGCWLSPDNRCRVTPRGFNANERLHDGFRLVLP